MTDSSPFSVPTAHRQEVASGERFAFGDNWSRFLAMLNDERIDSAVTSLRTWLGGESLQGKTFLDIGSGSGLFSLAARKLGARVHSFDYDPQSVACTTELRRLYFKDDQDWAVESGSALDVAYVQKLGQFDVVYSWGVLHHTGHMQGAFTTIADSVKPGGLLYIAIYNDQGWLSRYWLAVKKFYNTGVLGRALMTLLHWPYLVGLRAIVRKLTGKGKLERGMSLWFDMRDWLGGLPFEVGSPEAVFSWWHQRGYQLRKLRTYGGRSGCNEFVFQRA